MYILYVNTFRFTSRYIIHQQRRSSLTDAVCHRRWEKSENHASESCRTKTRCLQLHWIYSDTDKFSIVIILVRMTVFAVAHPQISKWLTHNVSQKYDELDLRETFHFETVTEQLNFHSLLRASFSWNLHMYQITCDTNQYMFSDFTDSSQNYPS